MLILFCQSWMLRRHLVCKRVSCFIGGRSCFRAREQDGNECVSVSMIISKTRWPRRGGRAWSLVVVILALLGIWSWTTLRDTEVETWTAHISEKHAYDYGLWPYSTEEMRSSAHDAAACAPREQPRDVPPATLDIQAGNEGIGNQLTFLYAQLALARVSGRRLILRPLHAGATPIPASSLVSMSQPALQESLLPLHAHLRQHAGSMQTVVRIRSPNLPRRDRRAVARRIEGTYLNDTAAHPHLLIEWHTFRQLWAEGDYNLIAGGWAGRPGSSFWDVRRLFTPSAAVRSVADGWRKDHPDPYMAIHLRRGDYERHCAFLEEIQFPMTSTALALRPDLLMLERSAYRRQCYPSPEEIAERLAAAAGTRASVLIVSNEDTNEADHLDTLLRRRHIHALRPTPNATAVEFWAQLLLASEAPVGFIGNGWSTASAWVLEQRHLRNTIGFTDVW